MALEAGCRISERSGRCSHTCTLRYSARRSDGHSLACMGNASERNWRFSELSSRSYSQFSIVYLLVFCRIRVFITVPPTLRRVSGRGWGTGHGDLFLERIGGPGGERHWRSEEGTNAPRHEECANSRDCLVLARSLVTRTELLDHIRIPVTLIRLSHTKIREVLLELVAVVAGSSLERLRLDSAPSAFSVRLNISNKADNWHLDSRLHHQKCLPFPSNQNLKKTFPLAFRRTGSSSLSSRPSQSPEALFCQNPWLYSCHRRVGNQKNRWKGHWWTVSIIPTVSSEFRLLKISWWDWDGKRALMTKLKNRVLLENQGNDSEKEKEEMEWIRTKTGYEIICQVEEVSLAHFPFL